MGGPVLVLAKPRAGRDAIGPVVEPLQQRVGTGPSGDDCVMTAPAAAKAPIYARNWGNFSAALVSVLRTTRALY